MCLVVSITFLFSELIIGFIVNSVCLWIANSSIYNQPAPKLVAELDILTDLADDGIVLVA